MSSNQPEAIMSRIVIIADDLSGAADCASAFVRSGRKTLVVLDREAAHGSDSQSAAVIAIDADTRRLPPEQAAAIHAELLDRYWTPAELLYKKIDSTLRGNFVQELAAIIGVAGLAIVAPAFPRAGRLTSRGRQYVNAVPLEQTEIWRNEGMTGTADIPAMLNRHGIHAVSIDIETIRLGPPRLRAILEQHAADGVQAVVLDVGREQDLQSIARATLDLRVRRFWVGSAGLSTHLSAMLPAAGPPPAAPSVFVEGAILTVVGSLSSVSRGQAEHLFDNADLNRIEVPVAALREGQSHPQWPEIRRAVADSLLANRDTLLLIGKEGTVIMDEGLQLCQALADMIAPLAGHIGAIVSTGGETARALLSAMGSQGLYLVGEVESGVPLSVAAGVHSVPVITKAGAFGSRETLLRCYHTLRQARIDQRARVNPAGT
ncbi:four-carbon acid sugar kinase family protein [Noviherbaspirillum pedocola]|uniref:Four-carbon acid sugar kinase family protein n=1 Tax=Noviherbaspirillum pedocola TaxID=2801341 RepID=A0A934SUD7_9BURK|nr:four-carbon acid sugar kinase family protein [Noviherbaspirillum pedocola]MBK4735351.1 four-carbon acid sugar kinase family protein [Noviherbaspirillum pedocola]